MLNCPLPLAALAHAEEEDGEEALLFLPTAIEALGDGEILMLALSLLLLLLPLLPPLPCSCPTSEFPLPDWFTISPVASSKQAGARACRGDDRLAA